MTSLRSHGIECWIQVNEQRLPIHQSEITVSEDTKTTTITCYAEVPMGEKYAVGVRTRRETWQQLDVKPAYPDLVSSIRIDGTYAAGDFFLDINRDQSHVRRSTYVSENKAQKWIFARSVLDDDGKALTEKEQQERGTVRVNIKRCRMGRLTKMTAPGLQINDISKEGQGKTKIALSTRYGDPEPVTRATSCEMTKDVRDLVDPPLAFLFRCQTRQVLQAMGIIPKSEADSDNDSDNDDEKPDVEVGNENAESLAEMKAQVNRMIAERDAANTRALKAERAIKKQNKRKRPISLEGSDSESSDEDISVVESSSDRKKLKSNDVIVIN